jgi:hypothetical protein
MPKWLLYCLFGAILILYTWFASTKKGTWLTLSLVLCAVMLLSYFTQQ